MRTLNIGKEKGWQKIKHYCAYQERSHKEVKEKLYSFGLYKTEVEALIAQLIEENFLNEERFALAYAGGKFRMKQWGRQKIKYALKQKQVSGYCISKALAAIGSDEYQKAIKKLAAEKLAILKAEKNLLNKKRKLQQYLLHKGFEPDIISQTLNDFF